MVTDSPHSYMLISQSPFPTCSSPLSFRMGVEKLSMLLSSALTAIGCVQPLDPPSRYGTWRAKTVVDEIRAEVPGGASVECMSLAWSADGQTLFAGYTDNLIRVYDVDTV
eukprot:Em0002g9a